MKEIIHIVGLNNEYKNDFISKLLLIDQNFNIIDIDNITQQINNDKKLSKLIDLYEKIKNDKNKSKSIANDINSNWARELQSKLNKLLVTDKNSILIGLTTSIINTGSPKILINLPTNYKFIVEIDLIDNAKQIIKNNLKEYKNEIVNGKFPLEYLNLDYLIKRREQLNQIYIKNLYIEKKIEDILKFLKENVTNNTNTKPKSKILYYASDIEHKKTITQKNITLYSNDILSILSVFNINNFEYNPELKIIKELEKDSLIELEKDCYVYEITDIDDIFFDGKNFKNNKKLKINKMTYIDCVYQVLEKYGIKFMKYK
uniref:Uncharacterized protein n=1 Tax=viral metagenome TaxID=1070528 RepID=A0A6C0H1E4_9ZZZZ